MGDFNVPCSRGWKNDITNSTGQEIYSLTSSAGYTQVVDNPIHVVSNSLSCIDLMICTRQNVISKHGVDVSIFDQKFSIRTFLQ